MMALACTYFPPTCAMTSAYSFSAPTAMILPPAPGWSAADEDVQPAASRAAPARAAHARMALGSLARFLRRFGMAGFSQVCGCRRGGLRERGSAGARERRAALARGAQSCGAPAGTGQGSEATRMARARTGSLSGWAVQRAPVTHGSQASRGNGRRLTDLDDCVT